MTRNPRDPDSTRWASMVLLFMGVLSCVLVYTFLTAVVGPTSDSSASKMDALGFVEVDRYRRAGGAGSEGGSDSVDGCCRGIQNLELWGAAVKWGSDFKFDSSQECCRACKAMCTGNDGPCLCDTWVFCGSKERCGSHFGECWLKKQQDTLAPEVHEIGENVIWTSGLVFGKGEGIVGFKTEYGTLRIKLYADCSPHSVAYILKLLTLRYCVGCQFYRAEGRGRSWDPNGHHIQDAQFGPPFALIQGTMEVEGETFTTKPVEACPTVRRGSIAWINSGPDFFISLADHDEWKQAYTVFGSVLPEDMFIAEKIAQLATESDVWNNINVSVLNDPVPFSVQRIKANHGKS